MRGGGLTRVGEGLVGAALIAGAVLTPFLRSRRSRWGATDSEIEQAWPGDDLVPHPRWQWTHAVTIEASSADVWPWLAQLGQGRGGFYSYEFLENLVGCDIHNADRIIPELQRLEVGDEIKVHPKTPGLPVAMVEPARALVLHAETSSLGTDGADFPEATPEQHVKVSWSFILDEAGRGTTRLISRYRVDHSGGFRNELSYGPWFVEPIGFVMDRKMLKGIKQRAEARTG